MSARMPLSRSPSAPPDDATGFPGWGILAGALQQTRGDALSIRGVFVTAVALGLANEAVPDAARSVLLHRVVHGLVVVAGTLAVLALADLARRLILYRRQNRRAWTLGWADHSHLLGFAIDTLPRGGRAPFPVLFVIRTPSGRYLQPMPEATDPDMVGIYPSGTWAHTVEPDYERGSYEVRVYDGTPPCELARATFHHV